MQRLILILLLVFSSPVIWAQEQLTKKQQADKLFDRFEYFKSVKIYLSIPDGKKDADVKERIAECYRRMNQYQEAEKWYALLLGVPKAPIRVSYNYAQVLLAEQKFEAAKEQFKRYYSQTRNSAELAQKIASCDSSALWISQTSSYSVENMQQINGPFADWGVNYWGDNALIFASDRMEPESKDIYQWNGNGWLKLYLADLQGTVTGKFPINLNNDYHVGPVAFNAAQDTAYVTVTNPAEKNRIPVYDAGNPPQRLYTRRLELLMITKQGGQWKNVKPFPFNNPNGYSVGHAALSKNGSIIYFTSDMPGGQGKTDIWYCQKQTNGTWGRPVNCGKMINTKEEEAFPAIDGNGSLYFSSKGLPGMGGYDIFVAKGDKAAWSKPVNLKYPLNSTSDDFSLSTKDGLNGYLSSDRQGGKGNDDIYSFKALNPVQKSPEIVVQQEPKSEAPVNSPAVSIPVPGPAAESQITSAQLIVGKTFILKNIYYDLDKSYIRADAAVELDKLLIILKENPNLRIELSSHTDSRASDEYNLELSQRRADAAVNYLIGKGIDKYRLVPKGYGEQRLLNKCANGVDCTEEEHQLNRRTEFKVLANK